MSSETQALRQAFHTLTVETRGPGFTEITRDVARWLVAAGSRDGLLTLFIRHTSASLVIQENADPDVQADLGTALEHLAPRTATLRARHRRAGRHASAHQVDADGGVARGAGDGRADGARDVAGHLRCRAPRSAAFAASGAALPRNSVGEVSAAGRVAGHKAQARRVGWGRQKLSQPDGPLHELTLSRHDQAFRRL